MAVLFKENFKIVSMVYEAGSYSYPDIIIEYNNLGQQGVVIWFDVNFMQPIEIKRKYLTPKDFDENIYKIVENWKKETYKPEVDVLDSVSWKLKFLLQDETEHIYSGYHVFPDNFYLFQKYFEYDV